MLKKLDAAQRLDQLAVELLKENDYDYPAATDALVAAVQADAQLYRALLDPMVRSACYEKISGLVRQSRQTITNPPVNFDQQRQRVIALAEGWLAFILPGGPILKDATREQLLAAAERYAKQARTEMHRARWLRTIADRLPTDRKVGDFFSDAQLGRLYRDTEEQTP